MVEDDTLTRLPDGLVSNQLTPDPAHQPFATRDHTVYTRRGTYLQGTAMAQKNTNSPRINGLTHRTLCRSSLKRYRVALPAISQAQTSEIPSSPLGDFTSSSPLLLPSHTLNNTEIHAGGGRRHLTHQNKS